jgi:hypothetical protein
VRSPDRDVDAGNSLIAASKNLAGESILSHLLLVAEAENGRLFASRDGKVTFRQRHWQFLQERTPRGTFGGGGAGDVNFLSGTENVLAHDDSQLFNRIRIKHPTGQIVESFDQTSIDAHFERVLEKDWPLASVVEAKDAADYLLAMSVASAQLHYT